MPSRAGTRTVSWTRGRRARSSRFGMVMASFMIGPSVVTPTVICCASSLAISSSPP